MIIHTIQCEQYATRQTMSNAIDILALRISFTYNTFQTMSHSHDTLTDINFKFLDNLVNYTTLELKYRFKIKITQRSVT